jgi:membrane-associated protease RseP (regulator of RpoE activity)
MRREKNMMHRGFRRTPLVFVLTVFSAAFVVSALSGAATQTSSVPGEPGEKGEKARAHAFVWKTAARGYLGVQVLDLTPELRRHFGVPEDSGVMIARVEEGPAAAAGVQVGDILTQVDGKPVSSPIDLVRVVRQKKAGELVPLELYRDGATVEVLVTVEERDRNVIDFPGIRVFPKIPDLPDFDVPVEAGPGYGFAFAGPELDEESMKAFEKAMEGIKDRFESKEWQEKIEKLRELDLSKIQERMKEVEERLKHLEKELQQEAPEKKQLDD